MQDEAIQIFCSTSDLNLPPLRWIFNKITFYFLLVLLSKERKIVYTYIYL